MCFFKEAAILLLAFAGNAFSQTYTKDNPLKVAFGANSRIGKALVKLLAKAIKSIGLLLEPALPHADQVV